MKLISRNVNGIRAVVQKWFTDRVQSTNADIYCFQETKAFEDQMPDEVRQVFSDYDYCRHAGSRPGYAGTAIFWRKGILKDAAYCNSFGDNQMFYEDGRVTELNFSPLVKEGSGEIWGEYCLLNIYFPNGNPRADGREMLTYKLKFYDTLIEYIQQKQKSWKKVIVLWDYNICHTEIDIARPKENEDSIGFLPIERAKVTEFLESGNMIDVFRYFSPEMTDKYTWRSYRAGARPRNVGRRLDYACVSKDMQEQLIAFEHQDQVMGSDHCPIELVID
jgi:exodeoxyribonuclease III